MKSLNLLIAGIMAVGFTEVFAQDTFKQLDGNFRIDYYLPEGRTALVVSVYGSLENEIWLQFKKPSTNNVTRFYFDKGPTNASYVTVIPSESVSVHRPIVFTGPGTFTVGDSGSVFGLVITDTEKKEVSTSPDGFPSTAVVIPSDAEGIVDIILESSTDLVNWNSANPGSYNADQENRFFRVRAVQR